MTVGGMGFIPERLLMMMMMITHSEEHAGINGKQVSSFDFVWQHKVVRGSVWGFRFRQLD